MNGYNWPSGFRGEIEIVNGRTTTESAYSISYPGAFDSGELKIGKLFNNLL